MMISRKYDFFIIILIASLSFGIIGQAYQVPRVLAVVFLPVLIASFKYARNYVKPYLLCFAAFCFFCLLSMAWTPDFDTGIKELVYYLVHFLLFLEVIVFSRLSKSPTYAVSMGWMVAVSMTLVVALWEIFTGHHLSMAVFKSEAIIKTGTEIVVRRNASVTFGNFNTYVTFLCFAFPFLLYRVSRIRGLKIRAAIPVIVVLLAAVCILFNASRGGILTLVGMSGIYVIMNSSNKYTLPLTIVIVLAAGYILYSNGNILDAINARSSEQGMFESNERIVIWIATMKAFVSTYGLGVGIGGMQVAIAQFTTGVTITHNLFLEILLQYGVIFFSVFLFFLVRLYKKTVKLNNVAIKTTLLMALITMPVYGIINSGYLLSPGFYVLLSSLIVFADDERTRFLRKAVRRLIQ